MKVLGLDLSINSTGVCLYSPKKSRYWIISSKLTKKQQAFSNDYITLVEYKKEQPAGEYTVKEAIKTENIQRIVREIENIINQTHPDRCTIEGISFGSTGSAALIDLTGLNYMVRSMLIRKHIPYYIISPTQNKKFATANGSAEKDVMIDAWKRLDKNIAQVNEIKIDDLADAYFLSRFGETLE